MAEMVFDVIQLGRQTVAGTAVAATKRWPGKADAPNLDRSYRTPDEDWGRIGLEQANRGNYGARGADCRLTADVTYETVMDALEMHLAGSIVPTGTNPYTWTYSADETSLTTKYYTIELGSETAQDQWRLTGCVIDELSLGFDALSAPGNAPWTLEGSVLALNREINALTGALSGPSVAESLEGIYTTLSEGSTATAFGSLPELAGSLKSFRLTSRMPFVRRIYGGTSDIATAWGLSEHGTVTFTAAVKIGGTAKTNLHDIYNVSGSTPTDRRWRIRHTSGTKTFTVDSRVRFTTTGRGNHEGEAIYEIEGVMAYDATLGSRLQIVSAGTAVASL